MDPVVVPARPGGGGGSGPSWMSTSTRTPRVTVRIDGGAERRSRNAAIGIQVACAFAALLSSFYAGARYGSGGISASHFTVSTKSSNSPDSDVVGAARPSAVNCSASCPRPWTPLQTSCDSSPLPTTTTTTTTTATNPASSSSPSPVATPSTSVATSTTASPTSIPSPQPLSSPPFPSPVPPSPSLALPWCTEGNVPGAWQHLNGTGETVVPLVDYGWDSRDITTKPPLAYGPGGLDFSSNGQGGSAPFMRHSPNEILQWRWVPSTCALRNLTKKEVQRMIGGLWIHLDGDSLQRDIYFDIAEALDGDNFQRVKAHEDISYGLPDGTLLTLGWNPAFKPNCDGAPWVGKHPTKAQPDIHIYNTGLWDIPHNTPMSDFRERIQCILTEKTRAPRTLTIARMNTVYAEKTVMAEANTKLRAYNAEWKSMIDSFNCGKISYLDRVHIFDPVPMVDSRPELSVDTVHYTGVGSKWFTLWLLNLVAACDEKCAVTPMVNWTVNTGCGTAASAPPPARRAITGGEEGRYGPVYGQIILP